MILKIVETWEIRHKDGFVPLSQVREAAALPRSGGTGRGAPGTALPTDFIDIVFTGPPGPEPTALVKVEDQQGRSIRHGEWIERGDGYWTLRIPSVDSPGPGP